MNKTFCLIAALCSLSISSASAFDCCVADWEVTAEFLYLKPTFDDTYFVINAPATTTLPTGQRQFNSIGFEPGFRIGGALSFCDCDRQLEIYYTRLSSESKRTVEGAHLWATAGHPDVTSSFENYSGSAFSKLDQLYQRVDAVLVQPAFCSGALTVGFQAGLEWAYLKLTEDLRYASQTSVGLVQHESKVWGIGPEIGFILGYHLWENCGSCPGSLSFVARSAVSLLASESEGTVQNALNSTILVDVHDEAIWRVVTALHARLGFNYLTKISCYETAFEIGYTLDSYIRGFGRTFFVDDVADSLSFTSLNNYDLQGLYISGTFKY